MGFTQTQLRSICSFTYQNFSIVRNGFVLLISTGILNTVYMEHLQPLCHKQIMRDCLGWKTLNYGVLYFSEPVSSIQTAYLTHFAKDNISFLLDWRFFLITFLYCILMKLYFVSFFIYPLVKNKIKKNQTYSDSVAGQKVSLFRAVFTSLYHLQLINSLQRKLQTKDTNRQASLFLHPCSSTLAVLAFKLPW